MTCTCFDMMRISLLCCLFSMPVSTLMPHVSIESVSMIVIGLPWFSSYLYEVIMTLSSQKKKRFFQHLLQGFSHKFKKIIFSRPLTLQTVLCILPDCCVSPFLISVSNILILFLMGHTLTDHGSWITWYWLIKPVQFCLEK